MSEQFFLYYLRQAFSGKITGETKFEQTADDYLKDYITKHKILGLKPLHSIEMYSIPNGWKWITIEQISEIVRGASPRPAGDPLYFGGDIPWFTVGSITKDDNMYLYDGHGFLTTSGKDHSRFISPETLLLTNSGATLGVPKITKVSGCINDGSVALLYIPPTLQKYLYYYLKMLTAKLRRINQGAAQPNLNTSIVKAIPFPLSPLEHQEKIVNYLDSNFSNILKKKQFIFKLKSNQKDLISKINKLEKSILNFAFLEKLT